MNTPPTTLPFSLQCDGHVHTSLCHHASGEMEEYVLSGIAKGLDEIVFLEHMESGVDYFESTWLTEDDFDHYFREGLRLQNKYRGRIEILLGVEVGYSPTHAQELLQRLAARRWDRIGISYHFMQSPHGGCHLNLVSRKEENIRAIADHGCDRTVLHYFKTLTEAVESLPGTVLCHLDAALRFQPDVAIDTAYIQPIRTLLAAVKKKGMALEINCSGFRIRGEAFPARFIVEEAIKLKIPLLPGSDAHRPEDVGRDFELLPDFLTNQQL